MTPDDIKLNRRCAGNVLRYHTWPTLQKQTVADHTFHVIRIYMETWGSDFLEPQGGLLLEYLIYHDMAEIATGDIPYPVKMQNPDLKSIMDKLEHEHHWNMRHTIPTVEDIYKTRAKLADLAEMYEFGKHELKLGNTMAEPICSRIWATCNQLSYEAFDRGDKEARQIMDYLNKVKT